MEETHPQGIWFQLPIRESGPRAKKVACPKIFCFEKDLNIVVPFNKFVEACKVI